MKVKPKARRSVGRPTATPTGGATPGPRDGLKLPHERDEASEATAAAPDAKMVQAKRDIDAGMVDTDMRVTPGLDAEHRADLVPGHGGRPAGKPAPLK